MDLPNLDHATVRASLTKRKSLPTLPTTFTKLIQVSSNPKASLLDLAQIIAYDPVLMANVLRVANSAYMGLSEPVEDLSAAILYLGMNEVKRIALSVGSFDVFCAKGISTSFLRNIWLHSLTSALINQQLTSNAQFEFSDEGYLAALLHDLGKLFFATSYAGVYAPLRVEVAEGVQNGLALESSVFGLTHVDAGEVLCEHWKLPHRVALTVMHHHNPERVQTKDDRLLVLSVACANVLAHQAIEDEPVEARLPDLQKWLAELAEHSPNPSALSPEAIENLRLLETDRARRLDSIMK